MAARSALKRFWRDERGATAVELGILVALICVVIIGAVTTLSGAISNRFDDASTALTNAS